MYACPSRWEHGAFAVVFLVIHTGFCLSGLKQKDGKQWHIAVGELGSHVVCYLNMISLASGLVLFY